MVVEEEVTETRLARVIRCDKCLKAIKDNYDKQHMEIVTFNAITTTADGKPKVAARGKYHLCCDCAFSMQWDFDENRKHWKERCGVTNEEQETLLAGLFPIKGGRKGNKRCITYS